MQAMQTQVRDATHYLIIRLVPGYLDYRPSLIVTVDSGERVRVVYDFSVANSHYRTGDCRHRSTDFLMPAER